MLTFFQIIIEEAKEGLPGSYVELCGGSPIAVPSAWLLRSEARLRKKSPKEKVKKLLSGLLSWEEYALFGGTTALRKSARGDAVLSALEGKS
jgi:hypothetical protein